MSFVQSTTCFNLFYEIPRKDFEIRCGLREFSQNILMPSGVYCSGNLIRLKFFEIILTYSSFITYKLLDYNKSTVPTAAIKTGLFDSAFVFEILSSYTECDCQVLIIENKNTLNF